MKKKPEKKPGVLPIPGQMVQHHLQTLDSMMTRWREKLPPVMLLSGPSGIGKRQIAYWLSQWITCETFGLAEPKEMGLFGGTDLGGGTESPDVKENRPCGECFSCQKMLNGNQVDFYEVKPEGGVDGKAGSIKIDQLRAITASQGFSAVEGDHKIILISGAEMMTIQAANSLLKILEEPPRGWVFFLTAPDVSTLLPTIVSRVQNIRLKPFSSDALLQLLTSNGVEESRAQICSQLAQGSWTRAKRLSDPDVWDRRQQVFHFFEHPGSELTPLTDWAATTSDQFSLLVDQMETCVMDLVGWSLNPGGYAWVNRDGQRQLEGHARRMVEYQGSLERARENWLSRAAHLASTRTQLGAPLNRKILAQNILMPWLQ